MFVKATISGIMGFLDLAAVPIRTILRRREDPDSPAKGSPKIALIQQTPDGISLEKRVVSGSKEICRSKASEMMDRKEKLALEGFSVEEVAALCVKHNYRWRFHPDSQSSLKLVVEPGKALEPDART